MARRVAILGYGTTPFRARWIDKSYYELAFDAARAAFEDAGLSHDQIESAGRLDRRPRRFDRHGLYREPPREG